jgi:hypothetical protein
MKIVSCSNCGTTIEDNQRFCRKCGQPINLSEATTRTLDPPSAVEQTTQHINSMPTGPSYFPPGSMPPMPAPTTTELRPAAQKRTVIVVAILIGFLVGALIVLAVITSMMSRNAASEQPATPQSQTPAPPGRTIPPVTPMPPVTEVPTPGRPSVSQPPTIPPAPPAPPAASGGATAISREMVYPGAKITTEINGPEGGSALHLQTGDSFDKVVAWYTAKLKPVNTLKTAGPTAILRGVGLSAIINSSGNGVNIFLKQE